jgi:glycosyltransferase involved in cell wall biosynthesis
MTQPFSPHICFVSLSAWPVLSGDASIPSVGGAEVQQLILARGLIGKGYRVSLICMDYGQPDKCIVDGITVYRCHAPREGIPVIRFLHPRLTTVWSAMKRANADIYYQRTCGALTGIVAAFCRRYQRKFIFAAAHDFDFDPQLPLIRYARDRALYRWGLQCADVVLTQSNYQLESCKIHFGRLALQLSNCYAPPDTASSDPLGYVLWAATMRKWKRPELFMDIAEKLPQIRFRMVGGPDDREYYEHLRRRALSIQNLQFGGFIPFVRIEQEFDGARVFVNTSESEGFPNTFLQAWSRAIPTVAFIDIQGPALPALQKAYSIEQMTGTVFQLMTNDGLWREAGEQFLGHFRDHYQPSRVVSQLASVVDGLLLERSRRDICRSTG